MRRGGKRYIGKDGKRRVLRRNDRILEEYWEMIGMKGLNINKHKQVPTSIE